MKDKITWVYHIEHLYFNEAHLPTIGSILDKRFRFTATLIFGRLLHHANCSLLWLFRLNLALNVFFYCLTANLTFNRLFCFCISFKDMLLATVHRFYIQSIGIYVLTFLAFFVFLLFDLFIVFLFTIKEYLLIVCSIIVILFLRFLTRIKKIKIQWNFFSMANFFMIFMLFIDW